MTQTRRWAALAVAVVLLALTLTGCAMHRSNKRTSPETTAMAMEQLQGLPSLEDTTAAVRKAVDQIAAEADRIIPGLRWEDMHGETTDRCEHPYDQTSGQRTYLPDRVAQNVSMTGPQWVEFQQAARRLAATAGAPTAQLLHNAPGNLEVAFVGPGGVSITIGYQGNLVVSGYTGCRLPAAQK